jgi:hypothetical protein
MQRRFRGFSARRKYLSSDYLAAKARAATDQAKVSSCSEPLHTTHEHTRACHSPVSRRALRCVQVTPLHPARFAYSDGKVANRDLRFRVGDRSRAVSRRPPISLDAIVHRTGGYTYYVGVWDLSIVQGPFSVAPCQTLKATIRTFCIAGSQAEMQATVRRHSREQKFFEQAARLERRRGSDLCVAELCVALLHEEAGEALLDDGVDTSDAEDAAERTERVLLTPERVSLRLRPSRLPSTGSLGAWR